MTLTRGSRVMRGEKDYFLPAGYTQVTASAKSGPQQTLAVSHRDRPRPVTARMATGCISISVFKIKTGKIEVCLQKRKLTAGTSPILFASCWERQLMAVASFCVTRAGICTNALQESYSILSVFVPFVVKMYKHFPGLSSVLFLIACFSQDSRVTG